MTTATKAWRRTRKASIPERIVNNALREFTDADFPVGTVAHQGDLIFVRIASVPKSGKVRRNLQLADGTTQGSRHILAGHVAVYDCDRGEAIAAIKAATKVTVAEQYVGPVFVGGTVTHPEHGHHTYQRNMTIACVYQRNLDAEEREQRSRD